MSSRRSTSTASRRGPPTVATGDRRRRARLTPTYPLPSARHAHCGSGGRPRPVEGRGGMLRCCGGPQLVGAAGMRRLPVAGRALKPGLALGEPVAPRYLRGGRRWWCHQPFSSKAPRRPWTSLQRGGALSPAGTPEGKEGGPEPALGTAPGELTADGGSQGPAPCPAPLA